MFNATNEFIPVAMVLGGGALIAAVWLGPGPGLFALAGTGVALYWGFQFFKMLEGRDRRDAAKRGKQKNGRGRRRR